MVVQIIKDGKLPALTSSRAASDSNNLRLIEWRAVAMISKLHFVTCSLWQL